MRPNISTILTLGLLCVEAASAVAIPRHQHANKLEARHRHHRYGGKGRNNETDVATATEPAGTGYEPTPILTGGASEPTEVLSGDDEYDDDDQDDNSSATSIASGNTYQLTGSFPTATPAAVTITPVSTTVANNDGASTTSSVPIETDAGSSTPSPSSSEDEEPAPATSASEPSTTAVVSSPAASAPVSTTPGSYWKPTAGLTWQIQLDGAITDLNLPVDVYDIDLFDSTPQLISSLHANNKKVICYFSAGSFETWRPDAASFTASDKGSPLAGWANEWWLNTNSDNVRTIMKARLDLAQSKGCDGVDPDNVDVYNNDNGLGITEAQSVDYLNFLATEAHARGLAMGLKNALEIVSEVLSAVDYQVNESCLEFSECDKLTPFITANKPVFHIEYNNASSPSKKRAADASCSFKGGDNFSSLMKNPNLDAYALACTGTLVA